MPPAKLSLGIISSHVLDTGRLGKNDQYPHFADEKTIVWRDLCIPCLSGLPWWFSKVSACNVGDLGSISGSGRSPGEGNGYPR